MKRAFTIAEAVISMLIVSVMLTAALRAAAQSVAAQYKAAERQTGGLLAQGLLNEILTRPYKDPETPGTFGIEPGEPVKGPRYGFDDVDDYNGLSESPPVDQDAKALTGLTGWTRSVTVQYVDPAKPDSVQVSDMGVKLITVTVLNGKAKVVVRTAVRADVP
jgi:MSHA pilin protein MshD